MMRIPTLSPGHLTRRYRRLLVGLVSAVCVVAMCSAPPPKAGPVKEATQKSVPVSLAEQKLGIQIVALRLSEAGHLLDLRYRVIDPEKAHAFLSRNARPHVEDPASGLTLSVPEMPNVGALRATAVKPEAGKVYFILFGNAGTAIKAGHKVDIVVGDVRITNVTVE